MDTRTALPPCTCATHPRKVDPACPLTAHYQAVRARRLVTDPRIAISERRRSLDRSLDADRAFALHAGHEVGEAPRS